MGCPALPCGHVPVFSALHLTPSRRLYTALALLFIGQSLARSTGCIIYSNGAGRTHWKNMVRQWHWQWHSYDHRVCCTVSWYPSAATCTASALITLFVLCGPSRTAGFLSEYCPYDGGLLLPVWPGVVPASAFTHWQFTGKAIIASPLVLPVAGATEVT